MKINIIGLHKAAVLLALYDNATLNEVDSKPMTKMTSCMSSPEPIKAALKEIEERSENRDYYFVSIDLGSGSRLLYVNLSGYEFESKSYDEYYGEGSAQAAISTLRKAVIAKYSKNTKEDSFTSLLAQVGSVMERQTTKDIGRPTIVNDKKDNSCIQRCKRVADAVIRRFSF
jgi:hypothetical protein